MYATQSYFARSYFGGIWGGIVEEGVIRPSSFVQNVLFGTPEIQLEVVSAGIVQNVDFGTPELQLQVRATGFEQLVQFGAPAIELEIRAIGIEQFIQFGIPDIQLEVLEQSILPASIEQPFAFGEPSVEVQLRISPTGIGQNIEFGIPRVYSPEYLTVNIRLVPMPELRVSTRPAHPLVQFGRTTANVGIQVSPINTVKEIQFDSLVAQADRILAEAQKTAANVKYNALIANTDEITARPVGGNEVARTIKVVLQRDSTGQLIATGPLTVQTQAVPVVPESRLDRLADVDASAEVEGGVPVYHPDGDKYVVEKLDFDNLDDIEEIDGGTF